LFRRQGYSATALNDIVDESSAPKGSFYHYFLGESPRSLSLLSKRPGDVSRKQCCSWL
jgi:hypothetical protein